MKTPISKLNKCAATRLLVKLAFELNLGGAEAEAEHDAMTRVTAVDLGDTRLEGQLSLAGDGKIRVGCHESEDSQRAKLLFHLTAQRTCETLGHLAIDFSATPVGARIDLNRRDIEHAVVADVELGLNPDLLDRDATDMFQALIVLQPAIIIRGRTAKACQSDGRQTDSEKRSDKLHLFIVTEAFRPNLQGKSAKRSRLSAARARDPLEDVENRFAFTKRVEKRSKRPKVETIGSKRHQVRRYALKLSNDDTDILGALASLNTEQLLHRPGEPAKSSSYRSPQAARPAMRPHAGAAGRIRHPPRTCSHKPVARNDRSAAASSI